MRILVLILSVAGLLAVGVSGSARAAGLPVKAKLSACQTSLDPIDRSFDTDAAMRRIKGTKRMGIRFSIQRRTTGQRRYHTFDGGAGFGVFFKSKKGVGLYRYSRTTNGLTTVPAYYRMRVGFRWYGAGGKVLKTTYRNTASCHQPDLRADLVVRKPKVTGRSATTDFFSFRVANRGHATITTPFDVSFTLGNGVVRPTRTVTQNLAPGQSKYLRFYGAKCATAGPPTVVLDTQDSVSEARETNNRFTFTCP
jgi:hypothetical protein